MGDILCDDPTYCNAKHKAKYEELEPLSVKGKKMPVGAKAKHARWGGPAACGAGSLAWCCCPGRVAWIMMLWWGAHGLCDMWMSALAGGPWRTQHRGERWAGV